MQQMLNTILNNYIKAKEEVFKNHEIANFLRNNTKKIIKQDVKLNSAQYKVEGSPGKGNWADVPWIAIFDIDITDTATKGYDIVYLFRADMSGVYISLNQGWTYFKDKYGGKEGKEKIRTVSNAWKRKLSSTLKDFTFDSIELRGISKSSDLAEGYELGHICGKFYERGNIPSDYELIEDLNKLLGVYRELKGKLIDNSIEKTNNYLIVNNNLGFIEGTEEVQELNSLDKTIDDYKNTSISLEGQPFSINYNQDEIINFTPRKINFLKKEKAQKKLGLAGELMVLKYEKDHLISLGKDKLANKVKHTSEELGDGAGYDILSYAEDGSEKYIEVKTTTGGKESSFILTSREIEFSKQNSKNYCLYRVFSFCAEKGEGKLYIFKGDLSKVLELEPQQFITTGLKNCQGVTQN